MRANNILRRVAINRIFTDLTAIVNARIGILAETIRTLV